MYGLGESDLDYYSTPCRGCGINLILSRRCEFDCKECTKKQEQLEYCGKCGDAKHE